MEYKKWRMEKDGKTAKCAQEKGISFGDWGCLARNVLVSGC